MHYIQSSAAPRPPSWVSRGMRRRGEDSPPPEPGGHYQDQVPDNKEDEE